MSEPTPPGPPAPGATAPSAVDEISGTASPDADSTPTATAAGQRANGTSLAAAPNVTTPADATGPSPIERLEVVCLVIEERPAIGEEDVVHAFGYTPEGDAWTVCGLPCGTWAVQAGGRPTCGPCDLGRAIL